MCACLINSMQLLLVAASSVGGGRPPAAVLLAPTASLTEQFAAAELAVLGGNVTNRGIPLPMINVSSAADLAQVNASLLVAVGYGASVLAGVQPAQLAGLGRDGLRISVLQRSTSGSRRSVVALSGAKSADRGALYACYEFLELSGVETMAWDLTTMPDGAPNAPLRLPEQDVIVQQPSFEYRDLVEWPVFSNRLANRRLRLNSAEEYECTQVTGNSYCKPPHNWDSFVYATPPGGSHTIYQLLCTNGTHTNTSRCPDLKPPQDLVKIHPEWFW